MFSLPRTRLDWTGLDAPVIVLVVAVLCYTDPAPAEIIAYLAPFLFIHLHPPSLFFLYDLYIHMYATLVLLFLAPVVVE